MKKFFVTLAMTLALVTPVMAGQKLDYNIPPITITDTAEQFNVDLLKLVVCEDKEDAIKMSDVYASVLNALMSGASEEALFENTSCGTVFSTSFNFTPLEAYYTAEGVEAYITEFSTESDGDVGYGVVAIEYFTKRLREESDSY